MYDGHKVHCFASGKKMGGEPVEEDSNFLWIGCGKHEGEEYVFYSFSQGLLTVLVAKNLGPCCWIAGQGGWWELLRHSLTMRMSSEMVLDSSKTSEENQAYANLLGNRLMPHETLGRTK